MERADAIFVDGVGAAAATSGVLSQLQGRIFAFLYLQDGPVSLDDIAAGLGQSKSNISINMRALLEWHLVRLSRLSGSRKDHYEAASDLWRVFMEILERRYRFNVRQVLAAVEEGKQAMAEAPAGDKAARERGEFVRQRLDALASFFQLLDAGIAAFTRGSPVEAESLRLKDGDKPPSPT